ncbi:MAG: YraN family protein [Caldilineaceae bacterium]
MLNPRRQLGNRGEELAAQMLIAAGLTLVDHNWRCAVGELDLIAEEEAFDFVKGGLNVWRVLIEVRTRRGERFGTAQQSITARKAAKLREVGSTYIQQIGWRGPWRIDVVAIQMDSQGRLQQIEHIRNAVTG